MVLSIIIVVVAFYIKKIKNIRKIYRPSSIVYYKSILFETKGPQKI